MGRKRIINQLFNMDARKLGVTIGRPNVDVVITSPPYGDMKDYGSGGQIGHGQDYENEYLPSLKAVFEQCYQVTKATGSMWVVVDTFKKRGELQLLPFEIVEMCRKPGWKLSDIIIWDKEKTLPWSHKGMLRNTFEYVLFFVKTKNHKYHIDRIKDPVNLKEWWVKYPERYSLGGKVPSNIWRIPIPVQGSWAQGDIKHACPFPSELVEKILLLTTDPGDVVLDPFSGSGTVLAQAFCMQRKYVGFEINSRFVERFKNSVLPSVKKKWKEAKAALHILEQRRTGFEKKIQTLRILKYPKAILKELSKIPLMTEGLVGVVVGPEVAPLKSRHKRTFARVAVTFLVEEQSKERQLELTEKINKATAAPPVSKFGIESDIRVCPASTFFGGVEKSSSAYLYLGGKTHYFAETATMEEVAKKLSWGGWKNFWKRGYPPIISSLDIRQEIDATWSSRRKRIDAKGSVI